MTDRATVTASAPAPLQSGASAHGAAPALRLQDAGLAFGSRTLWSGLDLTVAPGDFVAVLGANGSGKTSLLRTVLGEVTLTSGTGEISGRPLGRGSTDVGYVPQRIAIDGYVLTGFAGFQDLVNAVGGIGVDVPYAMHDPYSNADFPAGKRHMLGRDALAFSRDRHDVPGGDFGRSMNQGRLLIAALRQLKLDVARNPAALLTWVAAGAKVLHTDLGLSEIAELLLSMTSLDPGHVENRVVSGTGAMIGGLSVVRLGASAYATFRDLAADAILNGRP